MSLTTRLGTNRKVSGIRSVENSNVGWFPTNVPAKEPLYNSDPWADGSLLSELLALLLVDERSYVKEVEQIDEWGRVRGPPRLVLNGTETEVKSKAQAIQNLRICIRVLENIPNFPHISFTPEDLYERPPARSELLQTISTVFHLPSLHNAGDQPLHLLRNGRRYTPLRSSSAPPRLVQQRFPHIPIVNDPILQNNHKKQQPMTNKTMVYDSDNNDRRHPRVSSPNVKRSKSVDRFPVSPAVSRSRSPSPSVSRQRTSSVAPVSRTGSVATRYVPSQVRGRSYSNLSDNSARHSRSNSPNQTRHTARHTGNQSNKTYLNTLRNARHSHDTQTQSRDGYFRELDTPPRWRDTAVSSSGAGVSRHSHTPTKLRFASSKVNKNDFDTVESSKSVKSSRVAGLSDTVQQLQKTRALEMKRERLKVQQRDRRTRHSVLIMTSRDTSRHRDHARSVLSVSDNERDTDKKASCRDTRRGTTPPRKESKVERDLLRTGTHFKATQKTLVDDTQDRDTHNNNGCVAGYHSDTTSGTSSTHTTSNSSSKRPDWQWQPPKPSVSEIKAAESFVCPPVTATQQTLVRHWLCNLGVSLLDGEGGYFWTKDAFHQDNALHFPVTPVGDSPAATQPQGVLSLAQDRIRNGRLWLMLYNVLEPAAADSAQIPRLLNHLGNRTPTASVTNASTAINSVSLRQCKEVVLKALWLWRMKLSPGIAVSYFVRAEPVIQGEKNLVWGLLYHIMQVYSSETQNGVSQAMETTTLKPLPFSTFNNQTNNNNNNNKSETTREYNPDSQSTQNVLVSGLGYSVSQRRHLDQSLLQWLQEMNVLSSLVGVFPGRVPASVLALQSFLRDGTLLFHIAQLILKRSPRDDLPANLPHKSPHSFAQCLVNVKCVLEALRMCRDMPRRLFSTVSGTHSVATPCDTLAEAVCRGQWDVTLCLLEDMHLLYDHYFVDTSSSDASVHRRRLSVTPQMYPYLGLRHMREQQIHNECVAEQQRDTPAADVSHSQRDTVNNRVWRLEQLFPAAATQQDTATHNELSMSVMKRRHADVIYDTRHDTNNEDIFLKSTSSGVCRDDGDGDTECLIGAANSSVRDTRSRDTVTDNDDKHHDSLSVESDDNVHVGDKNHDKVETSDRQTPQKHRSHRYSKVNNVSKQDKENTSDNNNNNDNINDNSDDSDSDIDILAISETAPSQVNKTSKITQQSARPKTQTKTQNTPSVQPRSVTPISGHDLQSLARWLTDWLHLSEKEHSLFSTLIAQIHPDSVSSTMEPSNTQTLGAMFADGVLLGRLVMRLERTDLPGFVFRPVYPAQRWQNVRRSLECLAENNRKLPLRLLSCEEAIVSGRDDVAVLTLLQGLKKAYAHHIP